MKSADNLERLVLEKWPKLKETAQREKSPEKLIAVLEEIEDLLFNLEMRIAVEGRRPCPAQDEDSGRESPRDSSVACDPEMGSE
jgi:hypothetical protein